MSVAGTVLLLSVDRDFRAVHVDYHSLGLGSIHGLRLAVGSRLIRLRLSRFQLGSAPQSRTNADAKATLPAIQIFSEPINRNPARDRQGYFPATGKDTFARAWKSEEAVCRAVGPSLSIFVQE
jgi:hypothetical protein